MASPFQTDAFQIGAFQQTSPLDSVGAFTFGSRYYGQGYADTQGFTLHTLSATVSTTASISSILLITKMVAATVTATGIIGRGLFRTLEATVTTAAAVTSSIVEALNIRRAKTKSLILKHTTRALNGVREMLSLNPTLTTKDTTED